MTIPAWEDQKLGKELVDFLPEVRAFVFQRLLETGEFRISDLDHNSEGYVGVVSNKQVTIAAKLLDSSCTGKPMIERWRVVLKAAMK